MLSGVFYSFHDVRKKRRRKCREALFQVPVTPKLGTQEIARQAILMLANTLIIIYHLCFLLLKLYKNCLNKTIFDVAITINIISINYHTASS